MPSAEEFNALLPRVESAAKGTGSNLYRLTFSHALDHVGNYLEVEDDCESFGILIDRALIALGAPAANLEDQQAVLKENFAESFHIIPKKWFAVVSIVALVVFPLGIIGVSYEVVHQVVERGLVAEMEAEAARKLKEIEARVVEAEMILQRAIEIRDPHSSEGHSAGVIDASHGSQASR